MAVAVQVAVAVRAVVSDSGSSETGSSDTLVGGDYSDPELQVTQTKTLEWIRNKPKWQWSFWRKHMIIKLDEIKEKTRIAQEKQVTDKKGTEEQAKDDNQLQAVEEQETQEADKTEPTEKSQDGKAHKSK